jgi:hypothetical protein
MGHVEPRNKVSLSCFFFFSFEVMLKEYTSVVQVNAFTSTMLVNIKQFGNIFYTLCKCINFISKNVSASLRV